MNNPSTRTRLGALAAASVVLTSPATLLAANYTWQTTLPGTTNNWSTVGTDTNWYIDANTVLSPWADANAAIFDATTGEAVSLVGVVAPASTTVNNNGNWSLTGAGVLGGTGGTLTKNGTGTLTFSNTSNNTFSGGTTITAGTLAIGTGGTGANTSTVNALGTGTVAVNSGGTLKLWIQNSTAFTITNPLSIDGGNILNEDGNHTLSGAMTVGAGGATLRAKYATKNLTLTGILSGTGAVTVARAADGGGNADSTVILTNSNTYGGGTTVNSGQLQLGNVIATDKGGTGVIRGTLTVNSPGSATLGFTNALGYFGGQKVDTFNIVGATVSHTANGDNGWGITYNFTGGTLQATGTGRFTFGGGTSVNTNPAAGPASINGGILMRDGNAGNVVAINTADGNAFNDLAINANMIIGSGGTGVGITKAGLGTLLINGPANAYDGTTTVNAGTLALGTFGTMATTPVVVNATGTLRVDAAGKTLPSLTATNGSTLVLPAVAGGTTTVAGALNLADGGTISVAPIITSATVNGVYDLITAGSITGTGSVVAAPNSAYGPTRVTGTTAVNGNKLQFTVTGTGSSLTWNNASAAGAAVGTWDTNATANFSDGVGNDVFKAFNAVTFNDTVAAGVAKTVNVAGTVAPAAITVNNSTGNDYTLTATAAGLGQLAGGGSLTKTGTGTLTLGGNLDFASAGGVVSVGGGTLNLGGKTLPAQTGFALTGGSTLTSGTIPVTGSSNLQSGTISGVITGAGTFTKTTVGTVTLSGATNITGAGTISEGTLQVGIGTTAGTLGSGPVTIASGATLGFNRSDTAVPAIANALSGPGALVFNGTNNGTTNGQSSYSLSGNNSGFSGTISATNARLTLDNTNDTGTASMLTTGTNGQIFVTAGIIPNPMTISGNGWGEAGGQLGAIRAQGGTLSGPITLAGNSRITSHSGSTTLSGSIGETGGPRNLEFGGTSVATNITLTGNSTYTGTTAIGGTTAGQTATITLRGSLGSTTVTVNNGSTLAGNGSIAGSVNFTGAATNLGVNLGLPGALTVTGGVTLGGVTTATITPAPGLTPGGIVTLLNYGSITGTAANLAIATPANYRQAIINVGVTSATVDLGAKALTWTGTGGLVWAVGGTTNWTDTTPAASAYFQGDTVTFNDAAGAANAAVAVATAITPASVTVDNTLAVPYTFTGAGSVGGGASLVKNGNGPMTVTMAMPYTGGTTVNGGTLTFDANGGSNRQVNGGLITVNTGGTLEVRGVNALPNGANSVNPTVNGGTLRFVTGTSPSTTAAIGSHAHVNNLTLNGGTVDFIYSETNTGTAYNSESVQLNGTLTVGGGAPSTIQSEAATTNQGLALAGNRPFVIADVTASSASDLVITAEVENSDSNTGALTKTGAGTLELTAANSYTAGTTVSAGTLLLTNGAVGSATGTGAVSVAAGATVTGNGTASGAVTAAGTLAPASATSFLRTGALTLTGNYAATVDGANASVLEATGNINLAGATLNLTQVGAGVTEDSYIIGSWTGTRTGTFATVTGLPAGYSVQYDETGKFILLAVATGYTEWLAGYPGLVDTTADGDSDKDGIANVLEYILGGDPTLNSSALLPTQQIVGTNVVFTFKRSDDSEVDTIQTVQWTTDFVIWNDIAVNPAPAGNVSIAENGAADDDVTVTIPRNGEVKIFARLKATN
ncbi:beta strand repeat-containing protein [Luteolibacter sp. Populi]|uniref:beta strand repeat-containing protein n=1 Tax=Luteolibacter sp. Populi TaxID=3230487 RepID=UPI0034667215